MYVNYKVGNMGEEDGPGKSDRIKKKESWPWVHNKKFSS
jgi:hypothetical protein